jgi:ADP-L-glycero-D-manno-heptose 6-epimerase
MIIVTGGAGFIGSCLIAKLNQMGLTDILVVDHLGEGDKWKNLRGKRFSDYLDKDEFLDALFEEGLGQAVETVFHLGACSSTTERDAGYLMRNNFQYSRALCQWSLDSGVQFIYASSAATYGDGSQGYGDDEAGLDRLKPLNMYGFSKQLFDLWARDQGLLSRVAGFKFFNVYGPNEGHKGEMRSMVAKAWEQVRATGRLQLFKSDRPDFGDGEQKRDFIYVKDVVEALWTAYKNPDIRGLYNMGSGQARTWNELARAVFKALGKPEAIDYVEMPSQLKGKYQYFTQADMRKWNASAGELKLTSLEDAVKDYVQGYLEKGASL